MNFASAGEFVDVEIVGERNGHVGEIDADGAVCRRIHLYAVVIREIQVIVVKPAVGAQFDVHVVAGAFDVSSVVGVEKPVAPAIGVDAESGESALCGYGIEVKRQCRRIERYGTC